MRSPEGYRPVTADGGVEAFALLEALEWVETTLRAGHTLHAEATRLAADADEANAPELRGRGPVPVIDVAEGRWVVRHYFRGGAMAALLHDRYLRSGPRRPAAEARQACEAEKRGVPTPRVVAGAIYPSGLFYRADLVTEYVPRSRELADVLFGHPRDEGDLDFVDPTTALTQAGRLLVHASEAGLFHPDLNARNVLLAGDGDEVEPWLIDLDRCRFDVAGPDLVTATMARRMERSLRKIAAAEERTVEVDWMETFRTAVTEGGPLGTRAASPTEEGEA